MIAIMTTSIAAMTMSQRFLGARDDLRRDDAVRERSKQRI